MGDRQCNRQLGDAILVDGWTVALHDRVAMDSSQTARQWMDCGDVGLAMDSSAMLRWRAL